MKKIAQKILGLIVVLSTLESAFALDSGVQKLTSSIGATDYFKINCAGDTDHLNFKLFEGSAVVPVPTAVKTEDVLPQVLNATLTKLKLTATTSGIAAGASKEVTLKGGNGTYILTLDTFGTNLTIKTAQTYSVLYQCLNAAGKMAAGSSTLAKLGIESAKKTLANSKTAKYSISCKKDNIAGNTASLKVKLINKTNVAKPVETLLTSIEKETTVPGASGNLTAQVIKGSIAQNTIGDILDIQGGNGSYDVMVNSPANKALPYHFQYSCLNTNNVEAKTSPFQIVQDQ